MIETKIIKIDPENPEKEGIKEAARIINDGGLVAFPTDTVYGLGALYNNPKAIDRLYEVKERPKDKLFTVHISKKEVIKSLDCEIPYLAEVLMDRFWPGPLTIILNTKDRKKTIAFRMPNNKIAVSLINKSDGPVAAPSANVSGRRPPVDAEHVLKDLDGKIDAVIDGGTTAIGKESTIIDVTSFPYRVVREGAISKILIQDVWHSI